jgi:hypothetical protein
MLSHILTSGGMILLPAAGAKTVGPSAAVVMATMDITCSTQDATLHKTYMQVYGCMDATS